MAEELRREPALRAALDEAISKDPSLANDGARQLDFLYEQAGYMEERYLRYPVFFQE